MVIGMDKKSAMKILGLGPNATAPEAKSAFRTLAKSFHPDRFARQPERAGAAEKRMKEINAAFKFLSPLLPETAPSEGDTERASDHSISGFFSSVTRRFKKRPKSGPVKNSGQRVKASPPGRQGRPSRPPVKPGGRRPRRPGFDTILTGIEPGLDKRGPERRPLRRSTDPYDRFYKYMAVKKKIQKQRNRSKEMGIGRVEKVSPVSRVRPVGDD